MIARRCRLGEPHRLYLALAARMFPADELQSARTAMLIGWIVLGAGILLGPTRPDRTNAGEVPDRYQRVSTSDAQRAES
jgi:hypothetical protein